MNLRKIRIFTALVVIGVCAMAMLRGWDIVHFTMADAGSDVDQDQTMLPWVAVPGLAFNARELSLTVVTDPQDEKGFLKRRDEQADILSVRPLSPKYWLMLSEMRIVTRDLSSKVLEAFELSVLTGPNEDYIMSGRGVYGVTHWEILPQELRARAITDLAATLMTSSNPLDGARASLRIILSKKSEEDRNTIGSALRRVDGVSLERLAAVGL